MSFYRPCNPSLLSLTLYIVISSTMAGCAATRAITLHSEPEGARVSADGKYIGVTPISVNTEEVFPPRWIGTSYMVKGKLQIEKEGCDPLTLQVNDRLLAQDIRTKLQCAQNTTMTSPNPAALGVSTNEVRKESSTGDPISQRLQQLQKLFKQGEISQQEFSEHRKRILNEL